MSTMSVAEAKAALEQAQQDERKARRQTLIAKLKAIRADIVRARAEYADLSIKYRNGQRAVAEINSQIEQLHIQKGLLSKPECADLPELADDREVVRWKRAAARLDAEIAKLMEQRTEVQNTMPNIVTVVAFENTAGPGIIARLEQSEASLISELNGEGACGWKGSVRVA